MSQTTNSDENLRKLMQTETNSYSYDVKVTYVDSDGKERNFTIYWDAKDELDLKASLKNIATYFYVNSEAKKFPADDFGLSIILDIPDELPDELLDGSNMEFNEFYENNFKWEILDTKPINLPSVTTDHLLWLDSHPEFRI